MKKYIYVLAVLFFMLPGVVLAETNIKGYVIKSNTLFTSKANVTLDSCLVKVNGKASPDYGAPGSLHCLDSAEEVTILNYDTVISSTLSTCKKGYYYVSAKAMNGKYYKGFVCADNVQAEINIEKYRNEFTNAGFPESYFEKLTILKDAHPNWVFTAYKTGIDWKTAVSAESIRGISYIQVTNLDSGSKYISLEEGSYDPVNKQYIAQEGSNWYAANKETVAYYLDPRNFLLEKEIFMFENLGYNSKYQTLEGVQNILKNTGLYDFSNLFVEAATYNGNSISPLVLAARSRQEVAKSDGKLSDSANGSEFNGKKVYNFYNIGATNSCQINGKTVFNPVQCGLQYAYNKQWFDEKTAINGGATFLANGYINQKQNTIYFQKFNVTNNVYGNFSNQYMTNIQAPRSEGISTYDGYAKINGMLDSSIEFIIPVYENMPEQASTLPSVVNEEEKNKVEDDAKQEAEENSSKIVDIINSSGYKYNGDYLSEIKIGTSAGSITSKLKSIDSKIDIKITTTNSNGQTSEIKDSTILGTGDIVTIKSGNDTKTFRIVIYGDVNGDGKVTAQDYVKIKNYIMSSTELSGSYKLAADVNNDGSITAVDYVNIKNYIMGNNSVLK